MTLLTPDWPCPENVQAFYTTNKSVSASTDSKESYPFNLANHVGDDPVRVSNNRQWLESKLGCPIQWLVQTHSNTIHYTKEPQSENRFVTPAPTEAHADACMTTVPQYVCAVLTADCVPILLCDIHGKQVAAIHAGWRGLANNILEKTIEAFDCAPEEIMVWVGPHISAACYEVGPPVLEAFAGSDFDHCFKPSRPKHAYANLSAIVQKKLALMGIKSIHLSHECTYNNSSYFSWRRDGATGRQATGIWIKHNKES